MEKTKDAVKVLLEKAMDAHDAAQAVNFAQAACNAANALRVLNLIEIEKNK